MSLYNQVLTFENILHLELSLWIIIIYIKKCIFPSWKLVKLSNVNKKETIRFDG